MYMALLGTAESERLVRPTRSLHVVSDVISRPANYPCEDDFDAEWTSFAGNGETVPSSSHHLAETDLMRGAYAVTLMAHLEDSLRAHVIRQLDSIRLANLPKTFFAALQPAIDSLRGSVVRMVVNCAPRIGIGENGDSFYLAMLDNGVEVYATPLAVLSYVQGRIRSLFRIPTKDHPEFNGDREQFRSSKVALTRFHPDHLERASCDLVPVQRHPIEVAYVDRFGHMRVRSRDSATDVMRAVHDLCDERNLVGVAIDRGPVHSVLVGESLRALPDDTLGMYINPGDSDTTHYMELSHKWSPDLRPGAYEDFGRPRHGAEVAFSRL